MRQDLDVLKGIAIISVVLFHMGFLKTGYLGVDLFLVINGFLIIPSLFKSISNGSFNALDFFEKRILRLLPLISIASILCLLFGYFFMMPDNYENLAQSVIASNFMSENILSVLTTKNYWDVVNDYKPLMHLWYVGVLFQFYVAVPIILYFGKGFSKILKSDVRETMKWTLLGFSILSMAIYFAPEYMRGSRFYMLPSRFFEMGISGFAGICVKDTYIVRNRQKLIGTLGLIGLFMIGAIYTEVNYTNEYVKETLLLSTIVLSLYLVIFNSDNKHLNNKILSAIGKMSYSIFIWHQIIIAMYRYTKTSLFGLYDVAIIVLLIGTVSILSFLLIEKKTTISHKSLIGCAVLAIISCIPSLYIYNKGGVLYDVPELDAYTKNAHRGMFGEYCDRVYKMDSSFDKTDKANVLIVGNSFARDFANTILESKMKDSVNISYAYDWNARNIRERIRRSDFIFVHSLKQDVPDSIARIIPPTTMLKGIGTKSFGECNGQVYCKRNTEEYFNLTISMEKGTEETNARMKDSWGDNFVEFIDIARVDRNKVRVFTPNHKFISQDCRHLTRAGAEWYATQFDWNKILKKN